MKLEEVKQKYSTRHIHSLFFLITENCNLACKYCYERGKHQNKVMSNEVIDASLIFMFENAKKINRDHVVATLFGGEPTTVPVEKIQFLFDKGLEYSKKYNIRFISTMITNTYHLSDEMYNLFWKYQNDVNFGVQMSIDGIEKVQNMYRVLKDGSGTFDKVQETVFKYKKLFRNRDKQLSVHGCYNKHTMKYMYDSYMLFRYGWGMDRIWFIPVMEEYWEPEHVELYKKQMEKIYNDVIERYERTKNVDEIRNFAPLDRCFNKLSGGMRKPCAAGDDFATVTTEGELWPCHNFYFYDQKEKEFKFGDVFNGIDDDKRRLFIEVDGNDILCPKTCDHTYCYRCMAMYWAVNKSILVPILGHYCDMMKIDQELQNNLRKYMEEKGIGQKQRTNQDDGCCLCQQRG